MRFHFLGEKKYQNRMEPLRTVKPQKCVFEICHGLPLQPSFFFKYSNSLFGILLVCLLNCVHQPKKPDPPYAIFQQLLKSNSTEDVYECPGSNFNFTPAAVTDTGQTQCWDTTGALVACAGTGQDGEFNDIPIARSFSAPTQHCRYPNDYTTLDQVHGLTWKTCAQGLGGSDCSTGVMTPITWNSADAGAAGSCAELNTLNDGRGYAGKTNWRIPTIRELTSLVNSSGTAPYIDTAAFPNTNTLVAYISNTTRVPLPGQVFESDFALGNHVFSVGKSVVRYLRCVSGNPIPAPSFVDNSFLPPPAVATDTVFDQNTGLLWQKCAAGLTGAGCTVGVVNIITWAGALAYCDVLNFAGRTNWRLPNANEMISIVDYSAAAAPFIFGVFPNTPVAAVPFWTSTTGSSVLLARVFGFYPAGSGQSLNALKGLGTTGYVRCVTDGP
ncbi:DUF1566 domain-containing protein [Leptospira sp. FAT2]|nr:DUF1566 domain-containing protein [Leptospira sanjuanensis]MCG6166938.1 DUF1566 domain-containing protein [Leptospira sanjuanensis]MCG6192394.1 DUF1566 domain-containing protein [Leptospira sanjuanensis]